MAPPISSAMRKEEFYLTAQGDLAQSGLYDVVSLPAKLDNEVRVESRSLANVMPFRSISGGYVQEVTADQAVSKTIFLADLGDDRVTLLQPLPIVIERVAGQCNAYCYDLEEYASGEDEFDALSEIKASITALYFLLKAEQPNLGPLPRHQWHFLQQRIKEN